MLHMQSFLSFEQTYCISQTFGEKITFHYSLLCCSYMYVKENGNVNGVYIIYAQIVHACSTCDSRPHCLNYTVKVPWFS